MIGTAFRTRRRLGFVVLVAILVLVGGLAQGDSDTSRTEPGDDVALADEVTKSVQNGSGTASAGENITVVTTSERTTHGRDPSDVDERANLIVAFAPNESVLYANDSRHVYNDVDPVPGTKATVEYVAADRLDAEECGATTDCWRNVFERVNLTTGEVTRVYAALTSVDHGQWHDIDRVGPDRLLVADIARDRAFVINTTSKVVEWGWDAESDYSYDSGGPYPSDWTHINDVERLDDGRVMASLRNHDQVVFLDPAAGLLDDWTLGADDDHDTLHEQHNPDYIPEDRGGPAVVLADSESDRIVEFQREDGEWERTWTWSDDILDWPRDADRLPNGNTLVTDTDGGRVLEVAPDGRIVWSVDVRGGYDAERLGTGDESANGTSAAASTV